MTKRQIEIQGDVARVTLTQGFATLIDTKDVPKVEGFNWSALVLETRVYAVRTAWNNGRPKTIRMHRHILGVTEDIDVDHKSCDGLDNRRINLRTATRSQNNCNSRLCKSNTSGIKGVSWHKRAGKWRAQIVFAGEQRHIGLFDSIESAAAARAAAAENMHGEFTRFA